MRVATFIQQTPRSKSIISSKSEPEHEEAMKSVQKELFYVLDSLKAASCVLDNHVVWGWFYSTLLTVISWSLLVERKSQIIEDRQLW